MKKLLLVLAIFCMILPSCKKTTITLSVDKTEITADGIDVAKFKVIANDEDDVTKDARIFFSDTNKEVGGSSFSTTEPKTYSFYATYEDATSEKVTVTAIEVIDEGGNDEGNDDEENPVEGPITLSASTDTILADGKDVIEFTVMQDSIDVTSLAKFYVNDSLIGGNEFKTTVVGAYSVVAKKNDTIVSNEVKFFAKEVKGNDEGGEEDEEKPIEIKASKTTIIADGEDAITFTVTQDDKDVTEETVIYISENGMAKKLDGNVFTSTKTGSYKAYAKKDELKSNEIDITVEEVPVEPEKPIVLKADKTNVVANGSDAVTFTVTQDDNDVTSECEIYVNGSKLNDNKYVTYTAGTYNAYATKGELKSEEITITAEQAPDLGKTILFAEGVTPTSGWYDVNKIGDGNQNGDINMCWAATSSNIIQWWQDRYVAAGNTLPEGAISGDGEKYQLALMEMYHSQWDNSRGGDATHGVVWYFQGINVQQSASENTYAQPLEGNNGGYFASVWNEILPHVYHEYSQGGFNNLISQEYNNYTNWYKDENWQDLTNPERLARFSNFVKTFMERGMCGLGVSTSATLASSHHSVTLWGCEYDNATGIVTKIWISDSDDMASEPKHPVLHECTVSINETTGRIRFDGAAQTYYATGLYPVSGYKK